MKFKFKTTFILPFILVICILTANAQQINTPAASPAAKLEQSVGLISITIEYSRPSLKGRKIFGELEPYGNFWRTGANSATKITFSGDATVGGTALSKGSYAILTKPTQTSWEVFFYTYESGNWGSYVEKTPVVSYKVTPTTLASPVETFTIDINNLRNDGANIELSWETTKISIPVTLDTKKAVMSQIERFGQNPEASLGNAYSAAASYMLEEKENLNLALTYATKACEINPNAYWLFRTKSLIEAELGKYKEAIATAQISKAAAEKAGNAQYVKFNEDSIKSWSKKK